MQFIKTRNIITIILCVLLFPVSAFSTVCLQEDFNTSNSGMYGFGNRFGSPQLGCSYPVTWGGENYCIAHDATGDADGSGAAHIILDQNSSQFQFGWYDSNCGSWSNGDIVRFKFRIKYDDQYYWTEDHKVLEWGIGGYRFLLNSRSADNFASSCRANSSTTSGYCANHNGSGQGLACTSDADCTENGVQYECIPANSYTTSEGAFSLNHDIGTPCAGPAGDGGGEHISFPLNEWVWVQGAVKTGTNGYIKLWINNNDESEPNSCLGNATDCPASATYGYPAGTGSVSITDFTNWGQVDFGLYWQNTESRDMGMYYGAFEISQNESFDATWIESGGGDIDGVCGSSDGGTFSETPSSNLCSAGTAGTVTLDGSTYSWTCSGSGSGTDDSCTATYQASSGDTGLPFTADFETDLSEWSQGCTANVSRVTGGTSGSYAATAPLTTGTHSDNYCDKIFGDHVNYAGDAVDEFWLEFDSKIDSPYTWPSDSQKIAIVNFTDGVATDRRYQVYVYANTDGNYAIDTVNIGTWTFTELPNNTNLPATAVNLGSWDNIKLHVAVNTAGNSDGTVQLWVNDVLKVDYSNVNINESTGYMPNKLILSSYATDSSGSDGDQYWDNWTLTDSDPGWFSSEPASSGSVTRVSGVNPIRVSGVNPVHAN